MTTESEEKKIGRKPNLADQAVRQKDAALALCEAMNIPTAAELMKRFPYPPSRVHKLNGELHET